MGQTETLQYTLKNKFPEMISAVLGSSCHADVCSSVHFFVQDILLPCLYNGRKGSKLFVSIDVNETELEQVQSKLSVCQETVCTTSL